MRINEVTTLSLDGDVAVVTAASPPVNALRAGVWACVSAARKAVVAENKGFADVR